MKNSVTDKNGQLTQYGFDCGYVETIGDSQTYKKLWKEGGVFHLIKMSAECKVRLSYDDLITAKKDFKNTTL